VGRDREGLQLGFYLALLGAAGQQGGEAAGKGLSSQGSGVTEKFLFNLFYTLTFLWDFITRGSEDKNIF
jgi:hypothetical protein